MNGNDITMNGNDRNNHPHVLHAEQKESIVFNNDQILANRQMLIDFVSNAQSAHFLHKIPAALCPLCLFEYEPNQYNKILQAINDENIEAATALFDKRHPLYKVMKTNFLTKKKTLCVINKDALLSHMANDHVQFCELFILAKSGDNNGNNGNNYNTQEFRDTLTPHATHDPDYSVINYLGGIPFAGTMMQRNDIIRSNLSSSKIQSKFYCDFKYNYTNVCKKKLNELNENQKLWLHVDFKHDSNFTDKLNGKCDKQFTYPTFAYKQDEDEDDEDKQDEDNKDGKDNKDNKDGKTNKGKGKGKAKGKSKGEGKVKDGKGKGKGKGNDNDNDNDQFSIKLQPSGIVI
eukprot:35935_1